MKKQTYRYTLVAALCLPLFSTVAHSQVLVQHLGANDPLTEGFVLDTFLGNAEVGPVSNDLGYDAWSIRANTADEAIGYAHPLTEQDGLKAMAHGGKLSATLRLANLPDTGAQFLSF